MELESKAAELRKQGLGIAAISYDSVPVLAAFSSRRKISFPLLSDPDSTIIRRFGLLNESIEKPPYAGVPYPGFFITDASGRILEKHFEPLYQERVAIGTILAKTGATGSGGNIVRTAHFTLRQGISDQPAFPGQAIALTLDFEVAPGWHMYAPGDHSYRGLSLRFEENPLIDVLNIDLPEPSPFRFEPLDETVPVFRGRFRMVQEIRVDTGRDVNALFEGDSPTLFLRTTLGFQLCSESVCEPPAEIPLEWEVPLAPLDRERVPESLRRALNP